MMQGYRRSADKNIVICSADIAATLAFSLLTSDLRIELFYKIKMAHSTILSRIKHLGAAPFTATMSESEPLKIWSNSEKYLSLIISQHGGSADADFCICDSNRSVAIITTSGLLYLYRLVFNTVSKNIFLEDSPAKKRSFEQKVSAVLESPNRMEMPYFSALIIGKQAHFHLIKLETLASVQIVAIDTGPFGGAVGMGFCEFTIWSDMDPREIQLPESHREYFESLRLTVFQELRKELTQYKLGPNGLVEQGMYSRCASLSGKSVLAVDSHVEAFKMRYVDAKGLRVHIKAEKIVEIEALETERDNSVGQEEGGAEISEKVEESNTRN